MLYIILGFILGFTIPYLARRFSKFMPATFAYALYRIFKINKRVSLEKRKNSHKYRLLSGRYFMRSLGYGITTSALIFLVSISFSTEQTPWLVFLTFILLTLMEIDKRCFLLPDLLTVPLLIIGFAYAVFAGADLGDTPALATENSVTGAIFGYFVPALASLVLIKKHPDAFGGGDIKLLSAIGAWLGIVAMPYVILVSCFVFGISCFIKKEKSGAFGPAIVIASFLVLFFLYAHI